MLVKIKSIYEQHNYKLSVSKSTPLSELRRKLGNLTGEKAENHRLFYKGKQLEDCYTIFDYDVKNNDVLQLMIRDKLNAVQTEQPHSSSSSGLNISGDKPKEISIPAVSKYFEVGDYVDVRDRTHGAWFEARIMEIYSKCLDLGNASKAVQNQKIKTPSCTDNITAKDQSIDIPADLQPQQASSNQETTVASDEEETKRAVTQEMKVSNSNKETTAFMNQQKKRQNEESGASDDLFYSTMIDNEGNHTFIEASLQDIRPTARNKIKLSDLKKDDIVLVNYNIDEPRKIGNWYDFCVTESKMKKNGTELRGTLLVGREKLPVPNTKIWYLDEVFQIEKTYLLKNRSLADEKIMKMPTHRKSRNINHCTFCDSNPKKKCKECSCCVCGEKKDPEKQLLCDECDKAYHLTCLKPPLDQVPDVDWYCPECKTDENEIVKAGEKLKESKKRAKMPCKCSEKKRDWGSGMAYVGRTKQCTLVPFNHYGPIPGVEVGQAWLYRVQASEAGIHRPPVAGIHGREKDGAYSLVLSGGYEGDVDCGNEFYYTGSGGWDLSGNKHTVRQSSDQKLTRMNRALALNCHAKFNKKGAKAKNWRKGKPVRVVRSSKLDNHAKYAPKFGYRYDGIYRVVKYFPQKGKSGFIIWRYYLRRDDPTPAPWTPEGKKRIKRLGLEMPEVPEGFEIKQGKRKNANNKSKKQKHSTQGASASSNRKKQKVEAHSLSSAEVKLMERDKLNKRRWEECRQTLQEGKMKFLSMVQEAFQCVICLDLVRNPVTTPCEHNICNICLKRARSADVLTCPCCRAALGEDFVANVNKCLSDLLGKMFPGYARR